jgi:hypothetical protein
MERYENYNFKCLRCKDHGTRYLPSGATFTTCGTCGQLCKVSSTLNKTNNNENQNTNFRSPPINNENRPNDYDGFDEFRNYNDDIEYIDDEYDLIDATPDMYDFNNYSSHLDFIQNHNNNTNEYRREQFQGFMRNNNNNRSNNNNNNRNIINNNNNIIRPNNRDIDDSNNPNRGMFSISIGNDNYNRLSALRHRSQLNRNDLISDEELWEMELEAEMRNDLNRASHLFDGFSVNNNNNNRREEPLSIYSQLLLNNILPKEKLKPKLKKEKMTKKFWSKNDSGKLEAPTCCICLAIMKLNEEVTKLKCKHIFHVKCLEKWLENKEECPFCRGKIEQNSKSKK